MSADNWAVFRQDFTGNEFLVEANLTEERARALVCEFESHIHHQHYWACQRSERRIDFTQKLRDLLDSSSSLDASLSVLRNQNASIATSGEVAIVGVVGLSSPPRDP